MSPGPHSDRRHAGEKRHVGHRWGSDGAPSPGGRERGAHERVILGRLDRTQTIGADRNGGIGHGAAQRRRGVVAGVGARGARRRSPRPDRGRNCGVPRARDGRHEPALAEERMAPLELDEWRRPRQVGRCQQKRVDRLLARHVGRVAGGPLPRGLQHREPRLGARHLEPRGLAHDRGVGAAEARQRRGDPRIVGLLPLGEGEPELPPGARRFPTIGARRRGSPPRSPSRRCSRGRRAAPIPNFPRGGGGSTRGRRGPCPGGSTTKGARRGRSPRAP